MNLQELLSGPKGGSINWGKAVDSPGRDKGITSSYIRCHVNPAMAGMIGVALLTSAVMWIINTFSSSASMKRDSKIGTGDRPFNQGNRPKNNNRR